MVADSAHSDQPGDHNGEEGEPSQLAIDALMGAQPEETDKEEADTSEHPEPGDRLSDGSIDQVMSLLAAASDVEDRINLQPWIARHRSIDDRP